MSVLYNSLLGSYILKLLLSLGKFQEETSVLRVFKLSYSKRYSKSFVESFSECLFIERYDLNQGEFMWSGLRSRKK